MFDDHMLQDEDEEFKAADFEVVNDEFGNMYYFPVGSDKRADQKKPPKPKEFLSQDQHKFVLECVKLAKENRVGELKSLLAKAKNLEETMRAVERTGALFVNDSNISPWSIPMPDEQLNPLVAAAGYNSVETLKLLLDLRLLSIDSRGSNGISALMYSAMYGCNESVKILLQKGSSVLACDGIGKNSIHAACQFPNLETLKILVSHDTSAVNSVDLHGRTALHFAAQQGFVEGIRFLRSAGAEYALDEHGESPFSLLLEYVESDKSQKKKKRNKKDSSHLPKECIDMLIDIVIDQKEVVPPLLVFQGIPVDLKTALMARLKSTYSDIFQVVLEAWNPMDHLVRICSDEFLQTLFQSWKIETDELPTPLESFKKVLNILVLYSSKTTVHCLVSCLEDDSHSKWVNSQFLEAISRSLLSAARHCLYNLYQSDDLEEFIFSISRFYFKALFSYKEKDHEQVLETLMTLPSSFWLQLEDCLSTISSPVETDRINVLIYLYFMHCQFFSHYHWMSDDKKIGRTKHWKPLSYLEQEAPMCEVFKQFTQKYSKQLIHLMDFENQDSQSLLKYFSWFSRLDTFDLGTRSLFIQQASHVLDDGVSYEVNATRFSESLEEDENLFVQILSLPAKGLAVNLDVKWQGEAGIGSGPLRELVQHLFQFIWKRHPAQILHPSPTGEHLHINVAPCFADVGQAYEGLGRILGMSIANGVPVGMTFSDAFIKKALLNQQVGIDELKQFDPELYKSLTFLSEHDVSSLGYETHFSCVVEGKEWEMFPGGSSVLVTDLNKHQYVALYACFRLWGRAKESALLGTDGIKYVPEVDPFLRKIRQGFLDMVPAVLVKGMPVDDLRQLFSGPNRIDVERLKELVHLENGYKKTDMVIEWFWKMFADLSLEKQRKLLLFWTGSEFISVHAHPSDEQEGLVIDKAFVSVDKLPSASTWFDILITLSESPSSYTLHLPAYKSFEDLKLKFSQVLDLGYIGYDRA
jgi:hypothetical protein